ncbi:DNA polymerase IV [Teredinibacter haidensis]|uniref:DNA polymerase IV n=1 Tax=Teredinibacter haidensis TaxID=2731755 RepID=UPI000948BE37|nr:DNA polymerase IV [Teredinibacter haidensis]
MKKIIHIDADCFFAALEIRKNPKLAELPVAVGGAPDRRGVVATCNYLARQYGVKSAMASAYAKRLCPELVIVKPDIELYRHVSSQLLSIFHRYTECVEPLSLDEAYLDVSGCDLLKGSATLIARNIKEVVRAELGISVSAGVAPVKFLAKIASDWRKPDGLFAVPPDEVAPFVSKLPLARLPGVGPATERKLSRYGLLNCQDLKEFDPNTLAKEFGCFAQRLLDMSKGIDSRCVQPHHIRKSVSIERTYPEDISDPAQVPGYLDELIAGLRHRYGKLSNKYPISKKFVKLKFDNFEQTVLETKVSHLTDPFEAPEFMRLLLAAWYRQKRGIRLLGVGFRFAQSERCPEQILLPL